MATITGGTYYLTGTNTIWITAEWSESKSGNTNTVSVNLYANTKYRINGTWPCRLVIDGTTVSSASKLIQHGSNSTGGRTLIGSGSKTFTYSGSKNITISGHIDNFDYMSVSNGQWYHGTINASGTANLQVINSPPNTPTGVSCLDNAWSGYYVVENTVNLEVHTTTDPDGDTITYGIFGEALWPGQSNWARMGDVNSCVHWSSASRKASVNISAYDRGTQFRFWAKVADSNGSYSGTSPTISNIRRNRTPNNVTNVSIGANLAKTVVTTSWSAATDIDGQPCYYDVYFSKNDQSYAKMTAAQAATTYSLDSSGDIDGTTYRFKIVTSDNMCVSSGVESAKLIKRIIPTTPTNIQPSSGTYNGSVTITWGASTSPDGQSIKKYKVYINDNYVGETTSTSYVYNIPNDDAAGTAYTASVQAEIGTGTVSDKGYALGPFHKAGPPATPSWFNPTTEFHENDMSLSWEHITSGAIACTYELVLCVDDTWTTIKYGAGASHTFPISSISRGKSFQFAVQVTNSFGLKSGWKYSRWYKRNRLPLAPSIDYPISGSTIYDLSPRIAFTVSDHGDSHGQYVEVTCGGKTYSSITNSSMFSYREGIFTSTKKIVFTCPALSTGENTITVTSKDGVSSVSATKNFNISSVNNSDEYITAGYFNLLGNSINTSREAYGLSAYTFSDIVSNQTYVYATYMTQMRTAIDNMRSVINDYDSSNPDKVSTSWEAIGPNHYITKTSIDQITNALRNI